MISGSCASRRIDRRADRGHRRRKDPRLEAALPGGRHAAGQRRAAHRQSHGPQADHRIPRRGAACGSTPSGTTRAPNLLREDGEYGPPLAVQLDSAAGNGGHTILDPDDPNGRVYQAHYGITQEWADQLLSMGLPDGLAVSYDRVTGDVEATLADVAARRPAPRTSRSTSR